MSVLLKSRVRSPADYRRITVAPLTGAMGAEIRGADLARALDRDTREEILAAFQDYLVVYFPDQPLDNAQHQAFARIFGKNLMRIPQLTSLADCPDVQIVAREAAETETYVVGGNWHTDAPGWTSRPSASSCAPSRCRTMAATPPFPTNISPTRCCRRSSRTCSAN